MKAKGVADAIVAEANTPGSTCVNGWGTIIP
jgi:hypothetical protein